MIFLEILGKIYADVEIAKGLNTGNVYNGAQLCVPCTSLKNGAQIVDMRMLT